MLGWHCGRNAPALAGNAKKNAKMAAPSMPHAQYVRGQGHRLWITSTTRSYLKGDATTRDPEARTQRASPSHEDTGCRTTGGGQRSGPNPIPSHFQVEQWASGWPTRLGYSWRLAVPTCACRGYSRADTPSVALSRGQDAEQTFVTQQSRKVGYTRSLPWHHIELLHAQA
jgi:hypothetical protein